MYYSPILELIICILYIEYIEKVILELTKNSMAMSIQSRKNTNFTILVHPLTYMLGKPFHLP